MLPFEFFNVEQRLAELGLSPATLAFRLMGDDYQSRLAEWLNLDRDHKGGSVRMVALRDYNNFLVTQLRQGELSELEELRAKEITKKLTPFIREEHLKRLQIEVMQWPLPLKTALEIHTAEKVEPFEGLADMRQRVAGENRLLFVARDPFIKDGILIDVQVALVDKISSDIIAVRTGADGKGVARPKVAIFYAISNAEKVSGIAETFLRGVAGGITRYVPSVEIHSTLSPMPGFVQWVTGGNGFDAGVLEHAHALTGSKPLISVQQFGDTLLSIQKRELPEVDPRFLPVLSRVGALYLISGRLSQGRFRYSNSVANFHMPNGARLGRVIIGGDRSAKGRKQSGTLMANYFYEIDALDRLAQLNRAGKPQLSGDVESLLVPSTRAIGGPRQDLHFGRGVVYQL